MSIEFNKIHVYEVYLKSLMSDMKTATDDAKIKKIAEQADETVWLLKQQKKKAKAKFQKDIILIDQSIELWKTRYLAIKRSNLPSKHCPLCVVYSSLYDNIPHCLGCPIFFYTKANGCQNTNYAWTRYTSHCEDDKFFDTLMINELYEIRRKMIINFNRIPK